MNTLNLGVSMNQGDDFSQVIQMNDGDGNPIDITGYTFEGEMRSTTESTESVVAEFVFDILNQTTNKGQFVWGLPNEDTSDLVVSTSDANQKKRLTTPYVFDVKMANSLGIVSRIIQGIIYVSPQVTQETP